MSNLLFLSSEDFAIKNNQNNTILYNKIKGFSLVLFYSTHCVYCKKLIPVFKRLPDTITGCQFGILNVGVNRDIIERAKHTITPITYVPLVILYVNGEPYMRYDGPPVEHDIRRFIIEVSNSMQNKPEFSTQTMQIDKLIPAYTIGHPICGDDGVCYLEYNSAYSN